MYTKFTVLIFAGVISFSCGKNEVLNDPHENDYVYVCTSNSAETYHTFRECGKLKQCRQDILEVTRRKARENERIICITCKKREEESKNKDSVKSK